MSFQKFLARNKVGRINPGGGGRRRPREDEPGWNWKRDGNRSRRKRVRPPQGQALNRPNSFGGNRWT